MVLVNMLMEIDPLLMRGSMEMTMLMISPSRRDVSPGEQLRQSPRLVSPGSPRGGGASARKLASDFFQGERLHIAKDGHRRPARGPTRQGAHPGGRARPHPRGQGVAPSGGFFAQYFLYIPKLTFVEFQDFWSCVE